VLAQLKPHCCCCIIHYRN